MNKTKYKLLAGLAATVTSCLVQIHPASAVDIVKNSKLPDLGASPVNVSLGDPTIAIEGPAATELPAPGALDPAPGTFDLYLNGVLGAFVGAETSTANSANGNKLKSSIAGGYIQLYPGFAARSLNNVWYGVFSQLWITASNPGNAGINNNAATTQGTDSLYVRRAFAYIGTPTYGTIRIGQQDGPFGLFETGIVPVDDSGYLDGIFGGLTFLIPSAARANFMFAKNTPLYTVNRLTYLSPKFDGFMLGVGYAPNSNGFSQGITACALASTLCSNIGTVDAVGGVGSSYGSSWTDGIDVGVIKQGEYHKVGITTSLSMFHANPLNNDGPPIKLGNYRPVNVYQYALMLKYEHWLLGTNIKFGQTGDLYHQIQPGARSAFAWLAGAAYINGHYRVGAYYFDNQNAGVYDPGVTGNTLNEQGVAASIGYNFQLPMLKKYSPNFTEYLSYRWSQKHQAGYNFLTSSSGAANNTMHAQAIALMTVVDW